MNGLLPNPPAPPGIPPDMEDQLHMFLKAVAKGNPSLSLDKAKLKDIIHAVAAKVFETKLAQYPTTIEEDRELLLLNPRIGRRDRMALFVRIGEKVLLQEALDSVGARITQSSPVLREDGGPPKKRARVHG